MKKTLLLSGALFAATLAAAVTTNTASAAVDGNGGTSTADFTINGTTQKDTDNTLWLSAEPSFTFNAADLATIMAKGQTLDAATNDANKLSVNDFTGDSLGWTVSAQLSAFISEDKKDSITAYSLTFDQQLDEALNFSNNTIPQATLTAADTPVLTATAGEGQGTTNTKASGVKLDLQKDAKAKPQKYTANITWTLTQGKPAEGDEAAGQTNSNPD